MPDNCTVYHRAAGCGVCEFLRSPWLTSLVDPFVPPSSLPRPLFALRSTGTRFLLLHIFDCISLARNRVSKRFNDRFLVRSRVSFQLVSFRVCSSSRAFLSLFVSPLSFFVSFRPHRRQKYVSQIKENPVHGARFTGRIGARKTASR